MGGCQHPRAVSLLLQTGGPGGFDLAGLLNNPGFMSMVNVGPGRSQAVHLSFQGEMFRDVGIFGVL